MLIVNINPGGIAGGSGTQYFVGHFDGTRFTNANKPSEALWMDYGKDYYAAVSYFGHKPGDERRIMIGWFSNWQYANDTPETDWRGAMALPREITLVQTGEGVRVRQQPVRELDDLRQAVSAPAIVPAKQARAMTLAEANRQLQAAAEDGKRLRLKSFLRPEKRSTTALTYSAAESMELKSASITTSMKFTSTAPAQEKPVSANIFQAGRQRRLRRLQA